MRSVVSYRTNVPDCYYPGEHWTVFELDDDTTVIVREDTPWFEKLRLLEERGIRHDLVDTAQAFM